MNDWCILYRHNSESNMHKEGSFPDLGSFINIYDRIQELSAELEMMVQKSKNHDVSMNMLLSDI